MARAKRRRARARPPPPVEPFATRPPPTANRRLQALWLVAPEIARAEIEAALAAADGNAVRAAQALGIAPKSLYRWLLDGRLDGIRADARARLETYQADYAAACAARREVTAKRKAEL